MFLIREFSNVYSVGFGNRATDELSYLAVGVKASRIYTIDPQSQVRLLSHGVFRTTYEELHKMVDQIFPPIQSKTLTAVQVIDRSTPNNQPARDLDSETFNDFTFWRNPPMIIEEKMVNADVNNADNTPNKCSSPSRKNPVPTKSSHLTLADLRLRHPPGQPRPNSPLHSNSPSV